MMNSIFLFNLVLSTALVTLAQPRFDRPPSLPMDFPPNLLQQCQTLYRSLMQMNAIPAWNLTDANCCSTYKNDDGGANPWPWGTTIGADKPSIGCSLYNGSPSIDSIVVTTSPGCTGKFLDTRGLPQLKWLAITDCDLSTQSIPWDTFASYNPQLKIIFLSGLKLVGPLTPSVALLKNLEVLDLTNNFLSGSFPAELGNMISLKRLHLTGNLLSGYLPASLAQLVNLASLKLDSNHFMSPIPSLAAMSQLFACNLFIPSCRSTYEEWPVACLGNGSAPICGFAEPDPNAPIENAPAGLNIGFIVMAALGASLLAALIVGVFLVRKGRLSMLSFIKTPQTPITLSSASSTDNVFGLPSSGSSSSGSSTLSKGGERSDSTLDVEGGPSPSGHDLSQLPQWRLSSRLEFIRARDRAEQAGNLRA